MLRHALFAPKPSQSSMFGHRGERDEGRDFRVVFNNAMFHILPPPRDFIGFMRAPAPEQVAVLRRWLEEHTGYSEFHTPEEVADAMKLIDDDAIYAFMAIVFAA